MIDRILKVLGKFNEEIILYNGNYMIEDGIIDSVDVIGIVVDLEEEFNVSISAKYIVKENFVNKESIINLMRQVLSEGYNKNDKSN